MPRKPRAAREARIRHPRSVRLPIALTEAEWLLIQGAAAKDGMRGSTWIRTLVLERARRTVGPDRNHLLD